MDTCNGSSFSKKKKETNQNSFIKFSDLGIVIKRNSQTLTGFTVYYTAHITNLFQMISINLQE